MDAHRRTSTLRRVATTASLAALILIPAGQADAAKKKPKSPVITAVSPMKATVGQTLTIKGRHFRKGKGRNSVGFKRDGAAFEHRCAQIQVSILTRVGSEASKEPFIECSWFTSHCLCNLSAC